MTLAPLIALPLAVVIDNPKRGLTPSGVDWPPAADEDGRNLTEESKMKIRSTSKIKKNTEFVVYAAYGYINIEAGEVISQHATYAAAEKACTNSHYAIARACEVELA